MSAQSYPTIRLGEAVDRVTKGTTPTTHGYAYTNEGVSFLRVENLQNGVVDTSKVKTFISSDANRFLKRSSLESGDVLISIAGTIGRVAIVRDHDIPANTNQAVAIIRGAARRFEPVFLRYALESPLLHRHITGEARGGAMQNISLENVRNVIVPIPPFSEQQRIVAEIEKQFTRLEAGVVALRRVQANLKRYRAAVLKAACEGRLVPTEAGLAKTGNRKAQFESGAALLARILTERRQNWQRRGQYKEPAAPDTTILPTLPESWTWASLEQIARSSSYGTSAKCSPTNSGPPVLRIPNIASGRIDLTDLKFAGTGESLDAGDELAPGDLLIIRTNGSKNLIGRSAVVREKLGRPTSYASYLIRFRLFGLPTLFNWMGTIWDVSFLRAWIEQRAATSAGQHNISMSVLSTMPIPLPPLAEQTRIVAEVERRLSVVEEMEAVVFANLQRATRLRQSILQKAFTGELVIKGNQS
jgi:type I restriction enzyme S subunit